MHRPTPPRHLRRVQSPIGRLELAGDGEHLTALAIERAGELPWQDEPERSDPVLDLAAEQLAGYFEGRRADFDLPIAMHGTVFQRAVWQQLAELPFGSVTSYGQLGLAAGRAGAGRAVGGAVAANPVPIIVPCHRVLGADGRVTGYSGGEGIPTKIWLLEHEGIVHR